ncbi:beta-4C adrenergic receptor-like [Actinia tenebrosa]|uniref:Beta-4C adrenergic receptor-like n=1 Tax=Actinia tenebrosa TaxID=6105 RepID=A0A6P8J591_ACTTE|nr:beta-4C adrenergic receptor-like [Actinia tenebrosa]
MDVSNFNQSSNTTSCPAEILSLTAVKTVSSLNILFAVLSVGGNSLVLIALWRTPSMHNTSNVFVASLAFADLIVGSLANPLYVFLSLMKSLRDVRAIKNAETFVWLLTVTATTYNLCAVSIDRFIAVTKPLRYHQLVTIPRCLKAIGLTWIFAIIFASASFFVPLSDIASIWITGSVTTVFVPLVIISYCYFKIWRAVQHQVNMINAVDNSGDSQGIARNRAKNRKAAWTFGIIILLFGILFLPSLITNFIAIEAKTQCDFFEVNRIWFWTSVTSYSSSAINPWVYTIRMQEFRGAFKKIFKS